MSAKKLEIDPDQWERLQELVELVGGTVEDLVHEALELYLAGSEEDDAEPEDDCDVAQYEKLWASDDGHDEDADDVDAA